MNTNLRLLAKTYSQLSFLLHLHLCTRAVTCQSLYMMFRASENAQFQLPSSPNNISIQSNRANSQQKQIFITGSRVGVGVSVCSAEYAVLNSLWLARNGHIHKHRQVRYFCAVMAQGA
jgi:hypothetical protein